MQALKNQLIAAVDDAYLQGIKDLTTKYHNVTLLAMLEHLYNNYGKINEDAKQQNLKKMNMPYDVTTSIELFFQHIQDCIDFASTAQSPLTTEQILDSAFFTLQRTGVFNTKCRKWQKKQPLEKTWQHFKLSLKRPIPISKKIKT